MCRQQAIARALASATVVALSVGAGLTVATAAYIILRDANVLGIIALTFGASVGVILCASLLSVAETLRDRFATFNRE